MAWGDELYCSVDDLRSYLRLGATVDSAELAAVVEAASRSIDDLTDRQFGQVASAEARVYEAIWDYSWGLFVCEIDDLFTTDNLVVTVDSTALASTDYRLEPRNASQQGDPWIELFTEQASEPALGYGHREVDVTAEWGWSSVPLTIKEAALLQAARLFNRRKAPFGVAGSPEQGSEMRLLAKADPDVAVLTMIARYTRNRGFA